MNQANDSNHLWPRRLVASYYSNIIIQARILYAWKVTPSSSSKRKFYLRFLYNRLMDSFILTIKANMMAFIPFEM